MAKRPKWLDPQGEIPEFLCNMTWSAPDIPLVDRAFWLGDESTAHLDPWITALEAIDKQGDKGPLMALLKSERDLPHDVRIYLADLLARHQLKKKRGAESVPAYDRTDAEAMLELAIKDVRERESGISVKDALEKASKSRGIPHELLSSAYRGSRSSTRRMKKRRP